MAEGNRKRQKRPLTASDIRLNRIFAPLNTEVLESKRLSILAKLVYVAIHRWLRECACPNTADLASMSGVTQGRIKRALRDLEAAGWLKVTWPNSYDQGRIGYDLTEPPIVDRIAQIPVQSESPG